MINNSLQEITITALFLIILILFLNPFGLWMPDRVVYIMIAGVIILFALFTSFVWREKAHDEREQLHKMVAGRIAYLIGVGVLVFAIVVEGITAPHVDPWLVIALSGMVLGKILGLLYGKRKY